MKVGVLTFHEGINHGGFFQAYFFQQYLISLNLDVEIINYKNRHHLIKEYRAFLPVRHPAQLLRNIWKIAAFRKDQKLMRLFPHRLTTDPKFIRDNSDRFDYIFVGSDIVWDYEFQFSGEDPIYFAEGLTPKKKVVSYAASMGRASSTPPLYVIEGLKRFAHISVRDENTKKIVQDYTGFDVTKVVDPTLLLDIDSLDYPRQSEPVNIDGRYILIYAYYLPEKWRTLIERFAITRKLKIVVVGYPQPIRSINKTSLGPFDWLRYFQQADFVITSTFHGTIFSLLLEKPFLTVANPAIRYKAGSLLADLGIYERYETDEFDANKLIAEIDWGAIRECILLMRKYSEEFVLQALE